MNHITYINTMATTSGLIQKNNANIASTLGFHTIAVDCTGLSVQSNISKTLDGLLAGLHHQDVLFLQSPIYEDADLETNLFYRARDVFHSKVVIVLVDVKPLFENSELLKKYIPMYNQAAAIIVPSSLVATTLRALGVVTDHIIVQPIYDYYTSYEQGGPTDRNCFVYDSSFGCTSIRENWSSSCILNEYSDLSEPEYLAALSHSGFGICAYNLQSPEEVSNNEYSSLESPFRISTFLSMGLPVIVSKNMSCAEIVSKNQLGRVVDSLSDAISFSDQISPNEYQNYRNHVSGFSRLLRDGFYFKKAAFETINALFDASVPADFYPLFGINVLDFEETIDYLQTINASMVRFGDNEINLILQHSIAFQDYDEALSGRLFQILTSSFTDDLLVCLPNVFSGMAEYNDYARYFWKQQVSSHWNFYRSIKGDREFFGNSFVTRPYMDLMDKSLSEGYFNHLKSLWADKDILIVEGRLTRSGIGNDLFSNAHSIKRIICPSRNAFAKYDEILTTIKESHENRLILLMLGPTAKVLSFDLHSAGIRSLDIGHVDSEYEWFKCGATFKIKFKNKHTAEFNTDDGIELEENPEYSSQIIADLS